MQQCFRDLASTLGDNAFPVRSGCLRPLHCFSQRGSQPAGALIGPGLKHAQNLMFQAVLKGNGNGGLYCASQIGPSVLD